MTNILVANTKGGCGKSTLVASLADVLDADITDHDHQGTIRIASRFTNRHKPKKHGDSSLKKIIIHDTPPYNSGNLRSLLKECELIVMPTKLQYPDFLAMRALADEIVKLKLEGKTFIVYNEVRKPLNKTYVELKGLYEKNYPNLKKAKTELSQLVAFSRVLVEPLTGNALMQIKSLAEEFKI